MKIERVQDKKNNFEENKIGELIFYNFKRKLQ